MRNPPKTGRGRVGVKLTVKVALAPAANVKGTKGTWDKVNPAPETSMFAILPSAFPVFRTRTSTVPGVAEETGVSGKVIVWPGRMALAAEGLSTSYEKTGPWLDASRLKMTECSTKSLRTDPLAVSTCNGVWRPPKLRFLGGSIGVEAGGSLTGVEASV